MKKFVVALALSWMLCAVLADQLIDQTKREHSNYGNFRKVVEQARAELEEAAKHAGQPPPQKGDEVYFFFGISDLNHDGHLDGHELRVAFVKELDPEARPRTTLHDLEQMIDHVLHEDDRDGDGLISWAEYLESQLYHDESRAGAG
ncbi:hypothetical protein SeMB42_g03343 [Synchytrium endobioticum]|uniref:EF-hand domain-containing protein n=1 Tax=Synchytrium endobioticum TaxID=286115 RepID=A0A507D7A5_9FUNG|nr:hypothetical protein SeMB42_g03343 [Synchytrium endobioticum]TPX48685.1 hypothetical protein SeLEV6574_g01903 [Synchytrium endobioticum]